MRYDAEPWRTMRPSLPVPMVATPGCRCFTYNPEHFHDPHDQFDEIGSEVGWMHVGMHVGMHRGVHEGMRGVAMMLQGGYWGCDDATRWVCDVMMLQGGYWGCDEGGRGSIVHPDSLCSTLPLPDAPCRKTSCALSK